VAQVVECLSNNIFASIPQNIPFSSVWNLKVLQPFV
jgi:hypothetical protein